MLYNKSSSTQRLKKYVFSSWVYRSLKYVRLSWVVLHCWFGLSHILVLISQVSSRPIGMTRPIWMSFIFQASLVILSGWELRLKNRSESFCMCHICWDPISQKVKWPNSESNCDRIRLHRPRELTCNTTYQKTRIQGEMRTASHQWN